MGWGNALVKGVHKDAGTGRVTTLDGALHLQGDVKAKTRKLTWLADSVSRTPSPTPEPKPHPNPSPYPYPCPYPYPLPLPLPLPLTPSHQEGVGVRARVRVKGWG